MMKLLGFQVTGFRSVEDSGWITTDDVTALIGTNESGKTNLLLPLWKLNPAKDGEINLLQDAPRKRYNEIKNLKVKPVFITAHFELPDSLVSQIVTLTGASEEDVRVAEVSRRLDGKYIIAFPHAEVVRSLPKNEVEQLLSEAQKDLGGLSPASKAEQELKEAMLAALDNAKTIDLFGNETFDANALKGVKAEVERVNLVLVCGAK